MTQDDELTELERHIRGLVEAGLGENATYLLSRLGQDLGDSLAKLKAHNLTLTKFISTRLKDSYKLVNAGPYSNVQALARRDAAPGIASEMALVAPTVAADSIVPKKNATRFNFRFWAAFSVPYTQHLRYLNLNDCTFVDQDECPSGSYVLIEKDFVADPGAEKRDEVIITNIRSWIEKNHLEESRFYARPRDGKIKTVPSEDSVLELLVRSLDHKQLSRISLPLDIIDHLLKKKY